MKLSKTWLAPACATGLLFAATSASAALSGYSQDFEGLNMADPAALTNDGWLSFGNVFNPDGSYVGGYGPFGSPNGGAGFSAIDAGQGGPAQGVQQLSIYSDYNNADQGAGLLVEANTFQEQIVDASDVGSTWTFTFDAKEGNIELGSSAAAFIKTLDPNNGFFTTNFITFDSTSVGDLWGTYTLSLFIDPSLTGQILQFGFAGTATMFEGSGVFYDNVSFSQVPLPAAVWLLGSGLLGLIGLRRRS